MKWFKHETDAHTNLKLQSLINKFGLEALGYYWSCVELVGLQGENFRIRSKKDWKLYLKKFLGIEEKKQESFLDVMSEKDLIDKKALKIGDLYIPKLAERADDYTNKVRRKSGQCTDNVLLEENRREQKRTEENNKLPFQQFWDLYDKKVGRPKSEKKWNNLSLEIQKQILDYIPKYKKVQPDKKYRKNPETFFNNRSWEDELIIDTVKNNGAWKCEYGYMHKKGEECGHGIQRQMENKSSQFASQLSEKFKVNK